VDGRTHDVQVVRASYPYSGSHTVLAVRNWKFEPARVNGKPVPVKVRLVIAFQGPLRVIDMQRTAVDSMHVYEVRPHKDKRGFDLISDALPLGRLCTPNRMMQSITQSLSAAHMML
jgi:hypothetical protein